MKNTNPSPCFLAVVLALISPMFRSCIFFAEWSLKWDWPSRFTFKRCCERWLNIQLGQSDSISWNVFVQLIDCCFFFFYLFFYNTIWLQFLLPSTLPVSPPNLPFLPFPLSCPHLPSENSRPLRDFNLR